MRLPLLTRSHHDDVIAQYERRVSDAEARAASAERDRADLLAKLLRLTVGSDGEQRQAEPEEAPQAEPQGEVAEAIRATGSRRWRVVGRHIERKNAREHQLIQRGKAPDAEAAAAMAKMDEAFTQGRSSVSS